MAETVYHNFRGRWMGPGGALKGFGLVLGVLLLLGAALTSWYTVAPEEEAVVVRFGRYVSTAPPGLHFKLPFGIDRALKVPVTEVRKLEFGFRTKRAGVRTEYETPADAEEVTLMLTGDLNIASVEWVVQYKIKDAKAWSFQVRDREGTIRDLAESSMRAVVGDHTIMEVITEKREVIADSVRVRLQERLDNLDMGVHVGAVELQNATPPGPVQQSFDDVNAAQQERSRLENEAMQAYNKVIPLAEGEAEQQIAAAEGYSIDRVNRAKGDVARFTELLSAYRESREVTRQRLYLEAIQEILPRVKRVVVAEGGEVLKLLPLGGDSGGGR